MKELNLTLYEVFGYLLPGAISAAAIVVLFYLTTIFENQIYIPDATKTIAFIAVIISYYSGHIVQAIGNMIFKWIHDPEQEVFKNNGTLHVDTIKLVENKLISLYSIQNLSPALIYRLCDAYVVQYGNIGDREMFQYREGFYRGLSVSCMLLSVACLCMLFANPVKVLWDNHCIAVVDRKMFTFLMFLSFIGTIMFFNRYKRFADYKIVQAVTGFITIINKTELS